MTTIYQDDSRRIELSEHSLTIHRAAGGSLNVDLGSEIESPRDTTRDALRKKGVTGEWYELVVRRTGARKQYGGGLLAVLPEATRPAVEAALKGYWDSIEEARTNPANVERRRIENLFERSERERDEDYSLCLRLQAEAEEALKAWQVQYPEAARKEEVSILKGDAEKLESLAVGALTFDADGSISSEEQERRCAEFRAQKAEKLTRIAELEGASK